MENEKLMSTPVRQNRQDVKTTPFAVQQQRSVKSAKGTSGLTEVSSYIREENDKLASPNFIVGDINGKAAQSYDDDNAAHDPFVNHPDDKKVGKIWKPSPMAMPFLPRQLSNGHESNSFNVIQSQSPPKNQIFETPSSMASCRTPQDLGTPRTLPTVEGIFDYVYPLGNFASGDYTRYLLIAGVPDSLSLDALRMLIKGKTYRAPSTITESRCYKHTILLSFSNIVDSVNAAGEIPNKHSSWSVDFINARQYAEDQVAGSGSRTSIYKGQLAINATRRGTPQRFSELEIRDCVVDLLKNHGTILAFEVLNARYPVISIRMEYFDVHSSERAKAHLNQTVYGLLELAVVDYAPDLRAHQSIATRRTEIKTSAEDDFNTMVDSLTVDRVAEFVPLPVKTPGEFPKTPRSGFSFTTDHDNTPLSLIPSGPRLTPLTSSFGSTFPSATGYGFTPFNKLGPMSYSPFGGSPLSDYGMSIRGRRNPRMSPMGGNNVVNLQRIIHGQDVRTTIMLRNIPNKMPQSELKQLIDETNLGEYDFMYLRIDFANNCNVGYAFINFVDPLAIVKFVKARAGTKWLKYNSDKVAEISYATIQGKDCLIQKFRNSSVMLEDPSFRPKLFHTGPGPKAGKEETFPEPDNDSKLRRSIENAGAVGLFAPRAGQYFRETQRRRRSQFDRGTHLAQIEESMSPQSAPAHRTKF